MSADDYIDERDDEQTLGIPEFLLDPLSAIRRRRMPMILCFVLGMAVTIAAFATWKPVFRSTATVLITSQQIPQDFVRSTVPEDTLSNINAMVGQVLSLENISRVIDDLELFTAEARETVPRVELVNRVRRNVTTEPQINRSRGDAALVYGLSYRSGDPAEAADVANALAALFVDASISRRNQQAQQTTEFLQRELERNEKELSEHAARVSEFRRENRGQLPEELESNLRKLDMLEARRESIQQQISMKENRILTLRAPGSGAALSENEVLLGELRRELARETAAHTDEHPNVIALRDRIARLEESVSGTSNLSAAQRAIVQTETRDIERLQEQIHRIEDEMAEVDQRVDNTPAVAEQLDALTLREQVLREDQMESMRKVQAAELAESLEEARQGAQVSVLDAAQLPSQPTSSRFAILLLGLIGSSGLSVGIAVLLELVDPVVVGSRQLEKVADSPVLGSLPDVSA